MQLQVTPEVEVILSALKTTSPLLFIPPNKRKVRMMIIRDKKTILFQLREEAWLIIKGKEVYSVISIISLCNLFI